MRTEMNETSQTASCGANGSSVSVRAFVRSSTVTRGSRAEPRVELAVADVERDHARRAALEEDVGEAAGRGADVDAVEARRIDAERVEPVRELLAAARDVRRRPLDRELGVLLDLVARLVVAADETGEHERLRLRPRLREAALDEEDVEPLLHAVRTARPSTISRSTDVSATTSSSRTRARSAASSA